MDSVTLFAEFLFPAIRNQWPANFKHSSMQTFNHIWVMLMSNVHALVYTFKPNCVILTSNCYSYADILYALWLNWILFVCVWRALRYQKSTNTHTYTHTAGYCCIALSNWQPYLRKYEVRAKLMGLMKSWEVLPHQKPLMHRHIRLIDLSLIIASVACEYH